jgi:hypothetical protein
MSEPSLVPNHIQVLFDLTGKISFIRAELKTLLEPPHESLMSTEKLNELSRIIVKLKQIESDLVAEMQQKMKS